MTEVYSYEQTQPVIKEAFKKAIEHLQTTLGDQYSMNATKFAWNKFQDYVEQDIEFMMKCPRCHTTDIEGNFSFVYKYSKDNQVCYECRTELENDT
jgi:nanoRNase/pAp phosphatase (c-di-AMP/oligoRNAs hydrolase)